MNLFDLGNLGKIKSILLHSDNSKDITVLIKPINQISFNTEYFQRPCEPEIYLGSFLLYI